MWSIRDYLSNTSWRGSHCTSY